MEFSSRIRVPNLISVANLIGVPNLRSIIDAKVAPVHFCKKAAGDKHVDFHV
jgi:hypothetical protein